MSIMCSNIYAYTYNSTQQNTLHTTNINELNITYYVKGVQISEKFSCMPEFRHTEWMLTTDHNQN